MIRGGTIPALLLLCAGVCLAQGQPEPPSSYSHFWYWALVVGFAIYLVSAIFFGRTEKPVPPPPFLPPLSDNFGAAEYAPQNTQVPSGLADFGGVFFGKSSSPAMDDIPTSANPGAPVCSLPKKHVLIVAQTQAGKATRILTPTLLRSRLSSSFVVDPKGELAATTARARSVTSDVHIINPWRALPGVFEGLGFPPATYNPLDLLDRDDPNAVLIAKAMSAAICPRSGEGKDSYWSDTPANLLTAVLLWITYAPGETKTLAKAREIVTLTRKEFTEKYLVKMAACGAWEGAIRENATPFIDLADTTYTGLMSNLGTFTGFISDPRVKAATATSSFSMTDLTGWGKDRPSTVYLVASPETTDQTTWLRLMIAAGVNAFKRRPPGSSHRCMFILDEFANLGFLKEMPREISLVAGYGIDFTLIVQGLNQLKTTYGDAGATITSNCAYKWFCKVDDPETAKYVSEALGKKTVRTVGKGESEGQSVGPNPHENEGKSTNYGEAARDLLMPSEVLQLGRDTAILLAPGSRSPHYLRPVDYWPLPDAFGYVPGRLPKPLLGAPACSYDPNPTVPGSRGALLSPESRREIPHRSKAAVRLRHLCPKAGSISGPAVQSCAL